MYFKSRADAGKQLADELVKKYRYENCAVVALNDGGVMVGAQIAMELHCVLTMLQSEEINLPQEHVAVGGITQNGIFSYNNQYSSGQLEDFVTEYRGVIEEEKLRKIHEMNKLVGGGGLIKPELLRGQNIILVSDGVENGMLIELAIAYLKPIKIEKLIIATPFATIPAVDRMHIQADELYCLNVVDNFINIDHYYEEQDIPSHDVIVKTLEEIILKWK